MFEHCGKIIYTKYWGILAVCWKLGKFIYTNTEEYFMLNTGNIYLHKILRNTLCWALWEDLFTQNTEEYCMLSTVGRFYTKYLGLLLVEHCWNIYLFKILGNTLCWPMWEYLFTQNTEEYCLLSTVGRFIYTKYWGTLYVEHCRKTYLHKILGITSCWTLGIFIYIKYLEILCWALSDYLFTQNTGDYSMLNTVGRFIYTKYWEILYAEYCGNIYLHKILGITLCWTVGRFICTKYWEILYAEYCGNIYLHKTLRNTLCWTLWEDLFI